MSKYSVNELELSHARQLLNRMEAEFSYARQRIIYTCNSLYGQQGYGVSKIRNELDMQAGELRTQIENIGRLQDCMQYITNCTVLASNNARRELLDQDENQAMVAEPASMGFHNRKGMPEQVSLYEAMKQTRKGASGMQDMLEILGMDESELLDEVLDTPLMKGVKNIALVEKVWKASQEGDFETLSDMLVKEYGKANGIKGFEYEAYYTIGKVWGKNYNACVDKYMMEDVTLGNLAAVSWSLTGKTFLEAGAEIAYDKLTDIVPWYDDYYGGDVSGFYEKLGEIKDSIVDTYQIKGFGDAIVKVGQTTFSFYADKLSNLFKWRK